MWPRAWFAVPFESHSAMAAQMKSESQPALAAELARADADVLNGARTILARARKDLSYGAYPETAKQRFWEVTIFRVRPGREDVGDLLRGLRQVHGG